MPTKPIHLDFIDATLTGYSWDGQEEGQLDPEEWEEENGPWEDLPHKVVTPYVAIDLNPSFGIRGRSDPNHQHQYDCGVVLESSSNLGEVLDWLEEHDMAYARFEPRTVTVGVTPKQRELLKHISDEPIRPFVTYDLCFRTLGEAVHFRTAWSGKGGMIARSNYSWNPPPTGADLLCEMIFEATDDPYSDDKGHWANGEFIEHDGNNEYDRSDDEY